MKVIELTQGQVALVDDEDFDGLSRWKWCIAKTQSTIYAKRRRKNSKKCYTILMHRDIMLPDAGMVIDHIDGNGLNNQRYNLRICSQSQNMRNINSRSGASKYKGVCRWGDSGRWKAEIRKNKHSLHLGVFNDELIAAQHYDEAAKILFREFALLNFPNKNNREAENGVRFTIARRLHGYDCCRHGHEYTKENTRYQKERYRVCRRCGQERTKEWKARQG